MPVPTSNQGAESKRWLVPLLATRREAGGLRAADFGHLGPPAQRRWLVAEECSPDGRCSKG